MNAPLSLFLTHFSAPPPATVAFIEDVQELDPSVTLSPAELEAQLEMAAQDAKAEAEKRHKAETTALMAAHDAAIMEALAAARAEWVESVSGSLATTLDESITDLRTMLAERIAEVLRPLIADTIIARTKTELLDALDRLLADPTKPALSVRCPKDLGDALRAARPDASIEWVVADTLDVAITADATRIETKLGAALADIAATEI